MDEDKYVTREELSGFRSPTADEREWVSQNHCKSITKKEVILIFWAIFLSMIVIAAIVSVFLKQTSIIILMVALLTDILVIRSCVRNDKLAHLLHEGKFVVLDCNVYRTDMSLELTGESLAKICTSDGKYCTTLFRISDEAAEDWERNKDTEFLLLRCELKNYFLFSKKEFTKEG